MNFLFSTKYTFSEGMLVMSSVIHVNSDGATLIARHYSATVAGGASEVVHLLYTETE